MVERSWMISKNTKKPVDGKINFLICYHDLRHSGTSFLSANGIPMKQIQESLDTVIF